MWLQGIDWLATAACLSALAASGVLLWSVRFSLMQQRQLALNRVAESRFKWVDEFRGDVASYIAMGLVQVEKNRAAGGATFDPESSQRFLQKYHEIMLKLPAGKPHFDGFRTSLYQAIPKLHDLNNVKTGEFAIDLEHSALAVIETELAVAKRELLGGFDGYPG